MKKMKSKATKRSGKGKVVKGSIMNRMQRRSDFMKKSMRGMMK